MTDIICQCDICREMRYMSKHKGLIRDAANDDPGEQDEPPWCSEHRTYDCTSRTHAMEGAGY